jgi:hypothetical protein
MGPDSGTFSCDLLFRDLLTAAIDPNAVLDGSFKVKGVDGLRVVDISAWHQVPGFFVTTPTYMVRGQRVFPSVCKVFDGFVKISEKAADVIIAETKQKEMK